MSLSTRLLRGESLERRDLLVVPDFALVDVNPSSETFNENVSPRDFMGEVSVYYFTHST